jgi:hypothetical protein
MKRTRRVQTALCSETFNALDKLCGDNDVPMSAWLRKTITDQLRTDRYFERGKLDPAAYRKYETP